MQTTTETTILAELVLRFGGALNLHSIGEVMTLLREADISLPRLVTLSYLHRKGSASISQIGEHLGLALGTTSHLIDQLVQSGYVVRREAEQDRRHKEVSLTHTGQTLVERFHALRINEAAQHLARLHPELQRRLASALEDAISELCGATTLGP